MVLTGVVNMLVELCWAFTAGSQKYLYRVSHYMLTHTEIYRRILGYIGIYLLRCISVYLDMLSIYLDM